MDVIKHKQIKPITMMLSGGISGIGYLNDSDNTIYVTTTYVSGGATPPPGSAGFLVTVVNHDCYPYGENKGLAVFKNGVSWQQWLFSQLSYTWPSSASNNTYQNNDVAQFTVYGTNIGVIGGGPVSIYKNGVLATTFTLSGLVYYWNYQYSTTITEDTIFDVYESESTTVTLQPNTAGGDIWHVVSRVSDGYAYNTGTISQIDLALPVGVPLRFTVNYSGIESATVNLLRDGIPVVSLTGQSSNSYFDYTLESGYTYVATCALPVLGG